MIETEETRGGKSWGFNKRGFLLEEKATMSFGFFGGIL